MKSSSPLWKFVNSCRVFGTLLMTMGLAILVHRSILDRSLWDILPDQPEVTATTTFILGALTFAVGAYILSDPPEVIGQHLNRIVNGLGALNQQHTTNSPQHRVIRRGSQAWLVHTELPTGYTGLSQEDQTRLSEEVVEVMSGKRKVIVRPYQIHITCVETPVRQPNEDCSVDVFGRDLTTVKQNTEAKSQ